jgi:hypothetical protein
LSPSKKREKGNEMKKFHELQILSSVALGNFFYLSPKFRANIKACRGKGPLNFSTYFSSLIAVERFATIFFSHTILRVCFSYKSIFLDNHVKVYCHRQDEKVVHSDNLFAVFGD